MQKLTLSSKNQVVIPKSVRSKLGIGGGDVLIVDKVTGSSVVLKKAPTYHDLLGALKPQKQDAVKRVRKIRDGWR